MDSLDPVDISQFDPNEIDDEIHGGWFLRKILLLNTGDSTSRLRNSKRAESETLSLK